MGQLAGVKAGASWRNDFILYRGPGPLDLREEGLGARIPGSEGGGAGGPGPPGLREEGLGARTPGFEGGGAGGPDPWSEGGGAGGPDPWV